MNSDADAPAPYEQLADRIATGFLGEHPSQSSASRSVGLHRRMAWPCTRISINDALNTTERLNVLYKLAAASSVAVGAIAYVLALLTAQWAAAAAFSAPSAVVVYLSCVRLVEMYLWKWPSVRFLLGIALPDINGNWQGTIETRKRDGNQVAGNTGKMAIRQSWSTMGVTFETHRTVSTSVGAFLTQEAAHLVLTIEYQVEVRVPSADDSDVQAHKGTSRYRIPMNGSVCDLSTIEVSYYTDHRETGVIHLKRS